MAGMDPSLIQQQMINSTPPPSGQADNPITMRGLATENQGIAETLGLNVGSKSVLEAIFQGAGGLFGGLNMDQGTALKPDPSAGLQLGGIGNGKGR